MKKIWIISGAVLLAVIIAAGVFYGTLALFSGEFSGFNAKNLFSDEDISKEDIEKFNNVKDYLRNYFYMDVEDSDLVEGAIRGMAESLDDKYTYYLDEEEMQNLMESGRGSYVGIGVMVTQDDDNILRVLEPFADSPAKKAGLLPGDRIYKVNDIDVTGIEDEGIVISMIKGEEGTSVKLTIYRESENKLIDFEIIRKVIEIVNIESEQITDDIGYIKLIMFDGDIYLDFINEFNKLAKMGMKALIIDLRDNPGGDYNQVVEMVDMIVPSGLILYTENREGQRNEEISGPDEINIPIAVLVNGNSASASEILAGALQDYNKAEIIGTTTYGKGLVQSIIPFDDGSGLKITVASYYTPNGNNVQGEGITPDIIIELDEKYEYYPASMVPEEDDLQKQKAVEYILEELRRQQG